jgi:site-specific recombinase XerD
VNILRLKRDFLEHLEIEKGASLKTVENYDRYLTKIINHGKWQKPSDITPDSIREFRIWFNRQPASHVGTKRLPGKTISKKTQNYYLIALRMFLRYLSKRDIPALAADKIELAKTPERSLDLISQEDLSRLISAPVGSDLKSLRDKAILELLFSTGLRVSELCSLTRDMDFSHDEISVRGKGGKIRVVFISDSARKAVNDYLKKRGDFGEALFVRVGSEKGGLDALTRRSIERIVKTYAIKAGISKKVTPHVIRHCFATDLLQNGADIRSVQAMLGHANIMTTQIYTHVTDRALRDIHRKFHSKGKK